MTDLSPSGAQTPTDPTVLVLFGAAGDLAKRKLLPGLFSLEQAGLLPPVRIIGTSRRDLGDEFFQNFAREAIAEFGRTEAADDAVAEWTSRLSWVPSRADDMEALTAAVADAEKAIGGTPRRLHYLSIPAGAFQGIVAALGEAGLAERARVVIEKPFGHDLASSRELDEALHQAFSEEQIFRIDHFLGKESVQNILALRFANGMFEPAWNAEHIDHIQVDIPEKLGVEDRASFYEETGAFRDMVVTHLLQMLSFVTIEAPAALTAEAIIEAKDAFFDSLRPIEDADIVRGQFEGYRDIEGVADHSEVDTFIALKVESDAPRWKGVPFFLRTGKELAEGSRRITVAFKPKASTFGEGTDTAGEHTDRIVFDLGDPGGVSVRFRSKRPGPGFTLGAAQMTFSTEAAFGKGDVLEAYQRLFLDALAGDHTLFNDAKGIDRLWTISARVLEHPTALETYPTGSWGPQAADELIAPRRWQLPEEG